MTKKKTRATVVVILLSLVAAIIFSLISVSLAYFRVFMDKSGVNSVMVELIFDHLDFDTAETKEKLNAAGFFDVDENGNEIRWGSKENPYVISQKYHVQNLSVLQNSGFFAKRVGEDSDGKEVPEASYFLVCTPQGTAVTVDCQGMTIAPIGTAEYPFTGTVQGAPLSGGETTMYNDNETTLSTVANLRVEAKLDTPDIGFFGTLGYCGTKSSTENDLGEEVISVQGFGAVVQDLILADITVASKLSLKDTLEKWWGELFGGHLNRSEERGETHHVGIIAGHAEFATVKNVSVYYSEDVPAFELVSDASGSNTNYYSTTGLIGLLDHVNPVSSDGVLDGSNAISDSVLIGDGTGGGGGSESGTMTGYFLAKNLYDRHEATLSAEKITGKYNVAEMKEKDGNNVKDLFETVTMAEGTEIAGGWWDNYVYRNYFYFRDTVFTFSMSMSLEATKQGVATETPDPNKSDYVQRVWKLEEERPSISAADSLDSLQYGPDPTAAVQIAYNLKAVDQLTEDGYYVLAYLDQGATASTDDDTLYILNLNDTKNYVAVIPAEEIYNEPVYENGYISSIMLLSTSARFYDYTFQYDKSAGYSIRLPDTDYKFGITASDYSKPTTIVSTQNTSSGNVLGETAYTYGWEFNNKSDDAYRFSVTGRQTFGGTVIIYENRHYGWSKLQYDSGNISFYSEMEKGNSSKKNEEIPLYDNNYFTVFKVSINTYDENGNIDNYSTTGNEQLTPKNILSDDELYPFDPSKYVLQYINNETVEGYKLFPIRSLKLNDGQGNLLEELNHVVSLYKTHNQSYELNVGPFVSYNAGGVVNAPIGTTDLHQNYSIPTGMIAFDVQKASTEEKSYINIIVAINPEQEMAGTIGMWQMTEEFFTKTFNLEGAMASFELPISKTAKSSADKKYTIKIVEHWEEDKEDSTGKSVYHIVTDDDGNNEISYIYLGGNIAFVYHQFEVDSPGVYLIGSKAGPISVAYFSVTGAAGQGQDGMSGSPLGNVDFVYAFGNKIISTDMLSESGTIDLENEDYSKYHPSYLFVGMLPEKDEKIQKEVVKIRRYIAKEDDEFGTKRHISMTGEIYTTIRSVSPLLEDYQDDIDVKKSN